MKDFKTRIKNLIKQILLFFPFAGSRIRHYDLLKREIADIRRRCGFDPGHYYSPIPNLEEIEKDANRIFRKEIPLDINLDAAKQFESLVAISNFFDSYPYLHDSDVQGLRYTKKDSLYRYSDAVFLYGMLRLIRPQRIIEVGSGHSSAIMLDMNDLFLDGDTRFTFVEPYPEERLLKILKNKDKSRVRVIPSRVQDVSLKTFEALEANDFLFIDSTHVCKTGSDLNYLLFEVIPRLKTGVFIHFHDIFYPFEMPRDWVVKNHWFWNENYLLRAFLMNNSAYEIFLFNSYLIETNRDWFEKNMPECLRGSDGTGSIWLRKLAAK